MNQSSPNVWKVFLANKTAVFSLFFIGFCTVLSLLAYLIIPDNSPNANMQFPTIALQSPGFNTSVLYVPKNEIKDQSFLEILIGGKKKESDPYVYKEIEWGQKDFTIINHYNRPEVFAYLSFGKAERDPKTYIQKNYISNKYFVLGTDKFGRDIFSRIILGIRVSIFVGLVAVIISLFIGILIGSIGGYFGGKIDQFIMLIINVSWSIPTLLMVFAIVLAFDRGISVIFIAVGLTMWVEVARIVRGQIKSLREEQFIMATKNMGFGAPKIILVHLLPNIIGPVLVIAAANFSTAVLVEAGLSYLGFGIEPPTPSIGNILNEHYGYALTGKVFLAIVPAITIMLLVLSFNLVGSGLRDAFDVKRQK